MHKAACVLMTAALSTVARAGVVDFELGAPSAFVQTQALTDEYSPLGVVFSGPAPLNGGGVLNQIGNFGVPARSGTDFLAFNPLAVFVDGGVPLGPQTMTFASAQTLVEIYASGGHSDHAFRMDAFDAQDSLVATTGSVDGPAGVWTLLQVQGAGIRRVVLTEVTGDGVYVYDDLRFIPSGASATALAFGLLALSRRRRA